MQTVVASAVLPPRAPVGPAMRSGLRLAAPASPLSTHRAAGQARGVPQGAAPCRAALQTVGAAEEAIDAAPWGRTNNGWARLRAGAAAALAAAALAASPVPALAEAPEGSPGGGAGGGAEGGYEFCKPDADVAMLVSTEDCRKCERNDDGCLYLRRRVFSRAGRDIVIDQNQYNVAKINGRKSTGNAVWEGALALTEYMEEDLPEGYFQGKSVAELGAGPGYSSIVSSLLGASRVVATDGDPVVVELAKSNFANNLSAEEGGRVEARQLRWGVDNPKKAGPPFDVIIGSDLTYDNDCVAALIDTMQKLSKKETEILLIQQKRAWTDDAREIAQFEYAFNVERVDEGPEALKRHPTSYLLKMSNKPGFPRVPKEFVKGCSPI